MTVTPSANNPPLLQVQDLHVRFGPKEVVRGVNFHIAAGEKLALVGESGSGKTITALSLLRLAGNAAITGQATLQGRGDLLALTEREMRGVRGGDIAMVFQEPMTALNPLMTIGLQIAEILQLKKGLTGAQCAQAAIELLAQTGIDPAQVDELVLVMPRGHALDTDDDSPVPLATVLDHDFVSLARSTSLMRRIAAEAESINRPVRIRIQVRSFDAMCHMVSVGLGLAILPRAATAPHLAARALRLRPLGALNTRRRLLLAMRSQATLSGPAQALVDMVAARAVALGFAEPQL